MALKISIIIVVYNAATVLENAIQSVLAQNSDEYELLIIDGQSTDGTLAVIEKYIDKISYFVSEKDGGIYDAMNKGVKQAKGKWIYFMGADDIFYDNEVLKAVSREMIAFDTVYYGNVLFKHRNKIYDGKFNAIKLATRNISHQSIFYPRSVFVKYKFAVIYKIFADYYLNIMLFNDPMFKFKYIPITVAIFDDSGSSGSNVSDINFERNRLAIMKKYFPGIVSLYRICRSKIAKLIS